LKKVDKLIDFLRNRRFEFSRFISNWFFIFIYCSKLRFLTKSFLLSELNSWLCKKSNV